MENEDLNLGIESKKQTNTSPKSFNILEEKIEKSKKGNNLYDNFNVVSKNLITGSDDTKIIIYNK